MTDERHKEYCRRMSKVADDVSLPRTLRDAASISLIIAIMGNCMPIFDSEGNLNL